MFCRGFRTAASVHVSSRIFYPLSSGKVRAVVLVLNGDICPPTLYNGPLPRLGVPAIPQYDSQVLPVTKPSTTSAKTHLRFSHSPWVPGCESHISLPVQPIKARTGPRAGPGASALRLPLDCVVATGVPQGMSTHPHHEVGPTAFQPPGPGSGWDSARITGRRAPLVDSVVTTGVTTEHFNPNSNAHHSP